MKTKMISRFDFNHKILLTCIFSVLVILNAVSQFNVSYDRAAVHGKGNKKITVYYSGYKFHYRGESHKLFDLLGFRLSTGITNKFDLGIAYGRFIIEDNGANYIELSPKNFFC